MFGLPGGIPEALSAAEIREQEEEANQTIQRVLVASILLYLSPFAIDALSNFK